MGQLHELLAVEKDLLSGKAKIGGETLATFTKKISLFQGMIKKTILFDEKRYQEEKEEFQELMTTVLKKLNYNAISFVQYWNCKLQKEKANQEARSDVIVDGQTIMSDVPVTFLLSMESELKELRKIYSAIPTLQPGISWIHDETMGEGVYKTEHSIVKERTEKKTEHVVVVPPTTEHPAQVAKVSSDPIIGKSEQTNWSGMLSPADKSLMLSRIDSLLMAIKKARQRANNQKVSKDEIGKKIFEYIHAGIK